MEAVALSAMAVVPAYWFHEWPRQIATDSLLGIVAIGGMLGLVAGASRIGSPATRLAIFAFAVLLTWPPATDWLLSVLPQDLVQPTAGTPGQSACLACDELIRALIGRNGLIVAVNVLVIVAAVPLAIWRRPPARTADGTSVRSSRLVARIPILLIFGGPVLGVVGWFAFAPGDIYGGPLGFGVLVSLFGLLLFIGYSAWYALIGRPAPSAGVAVAYAATVILAPVGWAAIDGSLRLSWVT